MDEEWGYARWPEQRPAWRGLHPGERKSRGHFEQDHAAHSAGLNVKLQAYWWTMEIADLRSESIKLRRKTQRANRPEAAKKTAQYKEAKRVLGKTIQRNKASCWQTPTHVIDTVTIDRVVNALFPTHPRRDGDEVLASVRIGETTLIAEAELISAVHCMKNRKEQKVITTCFLHLLLRMYKEYLIAGIFPVWWKVARKGNPHFPSTYRSLCILDTARSCRSFDCSKRSRRLDTTPIDCIAFDGDVLPSAQYRRWWKPQNRRNMPLGEANHFAGNVRREECV